VTGDDDGLAHDHAPFKARIWRMRAAQRIRESEIIATDTSKILLASLQY